MADAREVHNTQCSIHGLNRSVWYFGSIPAIEFNYEIKVSGECDISGSAKCYFALVLTLVVTYICQLFILALH